MLGSLFNRSQQGGNSSTGGQNVKTSLRSFVSGGSPVGYSEFLGTGQPTTSYGYEGDIYVDLTPGAMSLYAHDGNRWIMWSGPSSSSHLSHPKDSNRWLWCNGQRFGWLPRNGRTAYNQGHSQSELLTFAISKQAEGPPKKRKSYDAGASDHLAAKKLKAEVREGSSAADSESRRSLSTSVGPISSTTCSPMLPPPTSAARSDSYSEPASAHSYNFPFPLVPDERATLLREINDLRAASSLAQHQLAAANEQISQLQADNDALRRELSAALSRILTGAGIPFSHLSSMASLDPERLQMTPPPPPRAFSVEQGPNHASSSHTKSLVPIPATPAGTSTLDGKVESNLVERRALLEETKVLIAAAHTQLDDLIAADESERSHQLSEANDDGGMASEEDQHLVNEGTQQGDDEGEGEELAGNDDEGADEELSSADAVEERPQADEADLDTPHDEDDVVETDMQKDLNSETDQDEVMDKADGHAEGQDMEMEMDEGLLLDGDTHDPGLSGQWDNYGEPLPEQNEDGATDTEEDQLFSPHADLNPLPEDDNGIEAFASFVHAKAERVTSAAVSDGLELDDDDDEDMESTAHSMSPGTPDADITYPQAHDHDDTLMQEHHDISVLEEISGAEAQDSDEDGSDIIEAAIDDERNAHDASPYGHDVTNPMPSTIEGSEDSETGEPGGNVSQETNVVVYDVEDNVAMPDETHVATESPVQFKREDTPPREGPVNQPQLETESLPVTLSQPSSWISRIPLPILFAKTKRYQLCRFCLTATPQIITKFSLALDLPAMEAHCNEKHEDYCTVLLDLSPQDLQGLLDAENSAREA